MLSNLNYYLKVLHTSHCLQKQTFLIKHYIADGLFSVLITKLILKFR